MVRFNGPFHNVVVDILDNVVRVVLTLGDREVEIEVPLERVAIRWKDGSAGAPASTAGNGSGDRRGADTFDPL